MKVLIILSGLISIVFLTGCASQPEMPECASQPEQAESLELKFYRHSWNYDQAWDGNLPDAPVDKDLPRLSEIRLKGGGGCVVYTSYNFHIVNIEGVVYARLDNGFSATRYFEVNPKKYYSFWKEYLACMETLNQENYGNNDNIISGGSDYTLIVEFKKEWKAHYKFYGVQDGQFENEHFERLFSQIMAMTDEPRWSLVSPHCKCCDEQTALWFLTCPNCGHVLLWCFRSGTVFMDINNLKDGVYVEGFDDPSATCRGCSKIHVTDFNPSTEEEIQALGYKPKEYE